MLCAMGYERTNIYLSKPQKAALEKIAMEKGLSVAELVRRIIDKELDRGQKQKG
jgi:predicted DNA-binding ribbon-helix-helix protein